jgi:outer membrane protein assembly factor BamA
LKTFIFFKYKAGSLLVRPEIKYYPALILAIMFSSTLLAQQAVLAPLEDTTITPKSAKYIIGEIDITGNKKTRRPIILREIPVHTGDAYSLSDLVKKFEDARRQLMNTALFHSVVVAAKGFRGNVIDISVTVKERWYLFPLPYLKPVDRNLNQWLVEQKASLSRVNYGVKVLYNNATGNNDKFRLWLLSGYTKQISIGYDRLYIDKAMKWGMKLSFAMGKNRELNYNTINDKQVFLKDNNRFVRNFFNTQAELTYRRAINTRHSIGIGYTSEVVEDTIVQLNPDYFKDGRHRLSFPEIYYNMSFYNVDYNPYPTRGYAANVNLRKSGIDRSNNIWQLQLKGLGSWPVTPKTFFSAMVFAGIKLPFRQPYFNARFLGYGDVFMQGYEYYVVDGVAGGYLKATFTREFLNFGIRIPRKGGKSETIPFRVFGKIYGNSGYVYNPEPGENVLSNRLLHSAGIGIDILTFYDVIFRFEYSFNQLGQNGLYLHRKSIF